MSKKLATVLGLAAALAAGSQALAKEIETDDVRLSAAGSHDGRATYTPWSGVWWPFSDLELAKGWNGTAADFTYDEAAKEWKRQNESKPVADRSPFLKYDEYVRLATGRDPQSALLECTGDDDSGFSHSIYGEEKERYDREGISYGWWGHCNGWCAAALMEQEPIAPIEARGVRFEVADLKGLLTESFWGCESDFTGKRYNKPKQYIIDSREPGKQLLAALNTQQPKPVAEYIGWYEKAYATTMTAAARAAAKPSDFKTKLENFETWYVNNYDNAYKDVPPEVFHKILETVIGRKKLAFVCDITANEEVWNHPAFAFSTSATLKREFQDAGAARKEWSVRTEVWYATDGVSESILGVSDFTRTYTYDLVTDADGRLKSGAWTGGSVDNHPDFCWLPTYNPTGVDYGENHAVLYGKISEILPAAHKTTDARAIDITVGGVRASARRANDKTTTWSQPVDASGDAAISVAVASGRAVARVKYFEQKVSGWSDVTATRDPLVALGEGTAAPAFGATIRFAAAGKKMVLAYAYDAAGKLLGVDEITLQYSTSGTGTGTGTGTTTDDAFEENDSKAAARDVAAGSFPNLACNDDDWFKITLAAQSNLSCRIDFQHSEGDLDMVLEGPAGQIAKSDSTSNQETCAGNNLAAGVYHLRVHGYNGAKAKYALAVTVQATGSGTGTGTSTDDRFEPNNSKAAAAALAAGTYADLKCNDDDWYKVTLASAGTISVRLAFRHAEGDIDMVLQNASGAEIGKSDSSSDAESISKSGLAAGTYYVRVYGYQGARAAYSLTLAVTASSTGGNTGTGTTTRTGTVTASTLNVRTGPGTTYPVTTTVRSGTVVTILEDRPSWYRVTWTGAPAGATQLWVSKSYVRVNP